MQCTALEKIDLPKELEHVEEGAFFGCTLLNNIALPNIVKIETMAFCDCKSLSNFTMTRRYTEIDKTAFCGCDSLKEINWI